MLATAGSARRTFGRAATARSRRSDARIRIGGDVTEVPFSPKDVVATLFASLGVDAMPEWAPLHSGTPEHGTFGYHAGATEMLRHARSWPVGYFQR